MDILEGKCLRIYRKGLERYMLCGGTAEKVIIILFITFFVEDVNC